MVTERPVISVNVRVVALGAGAGEGTAAGGVAGAVGAGLPQAEVTVNIAVTMINRHTQITLVFIEILLCNYYFRMSVVFGDCTIRALFRDGIISATRLAPILT
jgi:hypothetical protein